MKCNVGGYDRGARIVAGLGLIAFAFFGQEPLAYIGVVPLITGLFGFCPVYPIFKVNTACTKKSGCCTEQ